ncbi:MAG: DUF4190 domain-containing protein [Polyangiaceae bacterium]
MQSGFDPPPPPQNPPPPGYPPPPAQNPYAPYAQYPQMSPPPGYQQGYPPGYGGNPYGYGYVRPTENKAVTALVLGIVSIFCSFGFLTGIPAIILGVMSKRDIDRSAGTLGGGGMAIGGIVLGGLGSLIMVVYAGLMVTGFAMAAHAAKTVPTAPFPTYTPPVFPVPTATATGGTLGGGAVASTTMHGNVKVVSLGAGRPLQDQLVDLRTSEIADGRLPIVETTASWCTACKEIEATIDDPLIQKALDNVTLVKVDVDEFGSELSGLKMETNAIPFFYKIDSTARATDAISGDEWDDNTAANEAPVLGPFAKGTLKKRRHPSPVGTSL